MPKVFLWLRVLFLLMVTKPMAAIQPSGRGEILTLALDVAVAVSGLPMILLPIRTLTFCSSL